MRLFHGLSLLLMMCPSAAFAAEKPNVSAAPISNRLLEGQIELADGETIGFKTLEGTLVTVESPSTGSIAISGEVLDEATRQVRFVVFRVDSYGPGLQGLTQLDVIEVRDGMASSVRAVALAGLKVTGIQERSAVAENQNGDRRQGSDLQNGCTQPKSASAIEDEENICCVRCGNVTACGCRVTMSCGSCCAGSCCSGGGTKPDVPY